jgi:hypothetical protein
MTMSSRWLAQTYWKADTVTSGEASAAYKSIYVYSGGSLQDFQYVAQLKRSGAVQPGMTYSYASGTGIITVTNSGTTTMATGDVITVIGTFGNLA